jgi:hypothetical protein
MSAALLYVFYTSIAVESFSKIILSDNVELKILRFFDDEIIPIKEGFFCFETFVTGARPLLEAPIIICFTDLLKVATSH